VGVEDLDLDLDWLETWRTRKHLGLYCIRPFVRRLCLFSSVIYRGTRTTPSVRLPRGRAPNRSGPKRAASSCESPEPLGPKRVALSWESPKPLGPTEPSISEEGKLRARNDRLNFALSIRLPRNRKGFLTLTVSIFGCIPSI
jgi:hypothetical protein